jgi:Protein of unknown function (DUF2690)
MQSSFKSLAAKITALPAVTFIGLSAIAVPASASSGYGYDNQNPYSTGCFRGSYVAESTHIGPTGASIYLHYSPSCRTVWASVVNAPPQTANNAGGFADVHRNSDNARLTCNAGHKTSCYTNMLYDGGTTSHAFGEVDTGYEIFSAYTSNF